MSVNQGTQCVGFTCNRNVENRWGRTVFVVVEHLQQILGGFVGGTDTAYGGDIIHVEFLLDGFGEGEVGGGAEDDGDHYYRDRKSNKNAKYEKRDQ